MKPAFTDPEAQAEFEKGIAYYEEQRPGLGQEFREEVLRVIDEIRKNPFLGARYRRTEFRHFPMDRFPYVIYYVDLNDLIWVVAIAHGSRRPDYWRKRKLGP
jgi:toxin ParE1/3/4